MKNWCFFMVLIAGCQFRMDDQEAKESLHNIDIQFASLALENRNIHYAFVDQGKPTMLVFVHGSPGSWSAFIDFFKSDSLVNRFDLLSVDRPGFGFSDFGKAESSLEQQAFLINEVLKQFPDKSMILIGHSLGGPVIARMAMDFPGSYKGMILIAPSIDPDLEEDEWYRKVIDTEVGSLFTPKEFEVSNAEILPLQEELEKMIPFWSQIEIPTILIQGTDDSLVPKENADFAKRMMQDSVLEVRILEGVNHFIPWTHPEEIIEAIRQLTDR